MRLTLCGFALLGCLLLPALIVQGCKSAPPTQSANTSAAVEPPAPTNDKTASSAHSPTAVPKPPPPRATIARPAEPLSPTESLEQKLDQAFSELKAGTLAFSVPDKMKTTDSKIVVASIGSTKVTPENVTSSVTSNGGQIITQPVLVTPVMKMQLTSADFDIKPLSSEEQIVAGSTPTTWRWEVRPLHAGVLRLHLAAVVEIESLKRDLTAADREVTVTVDRADELTGFFKANWQWFLGGSAAGLFTALWGFFKKMRNGSKIEEKKG